MAKDLSPGVSAFAPPHRRRHLQSETYKTLVRILSLCGDYDRVSLPSRPGNDCPGNVENVAEKEVGGGSYNQADLARPDDENAGCSTVPVDSLVNKQLEGAICDKNRRSGYEHLMVNGTGHMMIMGECKNNSPRPVDKIAGENCVVVREKNNESSVSAQGHTIRAEIAVLKEDQPLNFADAPFEKVADHSDFQQTVVNKSVSLSHDTVSVPLQENVNDEDILEKKHVEDAFKGPDETEEIIQGKNMKAETHLPVGESEISVKEIFGLETGNDESFGLPKVAGNDLTGFGGQLADVDKLTPDVPEPLDVMEEFELGDAVMDDLWMIFEDDQALLTTDVGMTNVTSMGVKNSSGIDAFSTVKQSDLLNLMLDEHAHADKGQEEVGDCSEKASEGLYSVCGGHACTVANASVEARQSDLQKLEADTQMAGSNLQKAADDYSEKVNFLSLCNGPVQVSQSLEEKSLLSGTGSPLADSEIQLNNMIGFSDGKLSFPTVKTEKEEIEEGEISDCVEGTVSPLDVSPCHENMAMDKLETVQLSECVRSVKTLYSQEQPETEGLHVESLPAMSNNVLKGMEDATRSDGRRTVFETQSHGKLVAERNNCCPPVEEIKVNSVGCMKEGVNSDADLAHGVSIGSKGTVASEKGIGIDKKRKRSCLSEQRKEKKKIQKRKKRAEKNRELGVKRLKLPPMLPPKPKPVSVCRHFLKGRCQEGGNCKFSHDAVPLTKSKPCGHFARNACMKGDDCPFDHDLSKYPCNNFATTGSCFRGNSCLFSHKVMPNNGSELARDDDGKYKSASKLLATPSDMGLSKLAGIQGGARGNTLVSRTPGSSDIVKQNSTSFGKTQGHEIKRSANSVERSSSISSAKPSDCTPSSLKIVKGGQSSSHIISNGINDKQIGTSRTPLVAPKGINFLSFGVSPMDKPKPEKPISSSLALKLSALSSCLDAPKAEEPSQCVQAGSRDFMPKDSAPESKSPNEIIKVTPLLNVKSQGKALSTYTPIQVFSTPSPVKATSTSPLGTLPSIFSGNAGIKLFGGNHSIPGASGETSQTISPDDTKSLRILDFLASIGKKR